MTSPRKAAARAIADAGEGIVLARVEIAAPPERVFRALTTDELTKWWGSAELYRTTKFVIDLRPGGKFRWRWRSTDGAEFGFTGEFRGVVRGVVVANHQFGLPAQPCERNGRFLDAAQDLARLCYGEGRCND